MVACGLWGTGGVCRAGGLQYLPVAAGSVMLRHGVVRALTARGQRNSTARCVNKTLRLSSLTLLRLFPVWGTNIQFEQSFFKYKDRLFCHFRLS